MPTLEQWFECAGLPLEKCNGYRLRHGLGAITNTSTTGPGTEFKSLIDSLKIPEPEGCDCEALRLEMDTLGVEGCKRERERLLAAIRQNAGKVSWLAKVTAIGPAVLSGLAFTVNPLEVTGSLFDEAVRQAEAKPVAPPTKHVRKPCGGCTKRQAPLNRIVPFRDRQKERATRAAGTENRRNGQTTTGNTGVALTPLPFTGPITRHLHYFIWPVRDNRTWQHNLDQLLLRMDLFNGRRRIAIATSHNAHPPEAVQEYLKGHDCEFVTSANNPKLREVVTFLDLLAPLESTDPNQAIFFGHAKGVSHGQPDDPRKVEHHWATAMYDTCLDDWPAVESALISHAFAGSFRKFDQFKMAGHNRWHYAGTFYWGRSAFIFSRNWKQIDKLKYGSET
jgi:hypothetical protein